MNNISIFGTSSDAGKSTVTFLVARLLQARGYRVAPFKAQNVSNNAIVAHDGSEIAVAQGFQAEVLGVATSWHNNPILLKSGRGSSASLIVGGRAVETQDVRSYYRDLDTLKPIVTQAYEWLNDRYDCIIAEGAGSPVELNLMDKDLSNLFIATQFKTKIILVADIEKGGVFASIYGVYHLLPHALRANVIGVVINKFRGDRSLFDAGVRIIEEEFGIPVLGVLPYRPFNLGFEDSQSLKNFTQDCQHASRRIAVIHYPTMSNYNDFEPLLADPKSCVEFVTSAIDLTRFDWVILPGSKLILQDLAWLKASGLFEQIQSLYATKQCRIIGICGGYQMMFEAIVDEACIEVEHPTHATGLGFIDDTIYFQREKILKRNGDTFEIHHGISQKYPLSYEAPQLYGTFEHGLFVDAWFRDYKEQTITTFVEEMEAYFDIERVIADVS